MSVSAAEFTRQPEGSTWQMCNTALDRHTAFCQSLFYTIYDSVNWTHRVKQVTNPVRSHMEDSVDAIAWL